MESKISIFYYQYLQYYHIKLIEVVSFKKNVEIFIRIIKTKKNPKYLADKI